MESVRKDKRADVTQNEGSETNLNPWFHKCTVRNSAIWVTSTASVYIPIFSRFSSPLFSSINKRTHWVGVKRLSLHSFCFHLTGSRPRTNSHKRQFIYPKKLYPLLSAIMQIPKVIHNMWPQFKKKKNQAFCLNYKDLFTCYLVVFPF